LDSFQYERCAGDGWILTSYLGSPFTRPNSIRVEYQSCESVSLVPFCYIGYDDVFGHIELFPYIVSFPSKVNSGSFSFHEGPLHSVFTLAEDKRLLTPADKIIPGPCFSAGYNHPRSVTPLSVLDSISWHAAITMVGLLYSLASRFLISQSKVRPLFERKGNGSNK
jgi:hypothetical protein